MLAKMAYDPLFQCVPLKRYALAPGESQRNNPMVPQVLLVQLEVFKPDLPFRKKQDLFSDLGGIGDRVEASKWNFRLRSRGLGHKPGDSDRAERSQRHQSVPRARQSPLAPPP